MAEYPTYSTGTVSISNGNTSVVGSGTGWTDTDARAGDLIQIGTAQPVEIRDRTDATHLTLWAVWSGGTVSGGSYKVIKKSPSRFNATATMIEVSETFRAMNTDGFYFFVGDDETEPNPSYGNDGQYGLQAATGKLWLKTGGEWVYLGINKGVTPRGVYNPATAYAVNDVVSESGSAYMALQASTGLTPSTSPSYWMLLGTKGDTGNAATIAVGTVTTGAPGTSASVTNGGTSGAAVLDFTIPRGAPGAGDVSSINYGSEYATNLPLLRANIGVRERLSAPRTYYTDYTSGSDTTGDGSIGNPWKTPQNAYFWCQANLDLGGYVLTIKVADGTDTTGISVAGPMVGITDENSVIILGNLTTPANCTISNSAATTVYGAFGAKFRLRGFKISSGGRSAIWAHQNAWISYDHIDFGTCVTAHCECAKGGRTFDYGDITISGGALAHLLSYATGEAFTTTGTTTLVGTPGFAAFAYALGGVIACHTKTFVGSATGVRFVVKIGGQVGADSATHFPGSLPGYTDDMSIWNAADGTSAGTYPIKKTLQSDGLFWRNIADKFLLYVDNNGTSVNGLAVYPSNTGERVRVEPVGDDVNISLQLKAKGATGQIVLGDGTGAARCNIDGNTAGGAAVYFSEAGVARCGVGNEAGIIGGSGSASKLTMYSSTNAFQMFGLGAGTVTSDASGNLSASSDERLKVVHGRFNRGLDEILQIEPITYSWNADSGMETEGRYSGFSAQNVQSAIPEAIGAMPDGMLTLQDRPLIAALVNAVHTLNDRLVELEARNQNNL